MLPILRWSPDEKVDIHVHSHYSDGIHTPSELVCMAANLGIRILSLTDHASMAGIPEAVLTGIEHGVYVLPGIELNGTNWDFLGFLADEHHPALISFLARYHELRRQRMQEILELTTRFYGLIEWKELEEFARPARPARTHLASLLVNRGIFKDVNSAFQNFLGRGRRGYVPSSGPSDKECVQAIRDAGGVVLLAHPGWVLERMDLPLLPELQRLHEWGVVGSERVLLSSEDHSRQSEWQHALAALDWLEITGSNFHGDGVTDVCLGCSTHGADRVASLLEHLPGNCLHKAWFKRLFWRATNLNREEQRSSLTPVQIYLNNLARPDLMDFDPAVPSMPPGFAGCPFVLIGPGAAGREGRVVEELQLFGCTPVRRLALYDYPKVAWTLYKLYRFSSDRKQKELFKFSLDRYLHGDLAEQAILIFFRPDTGVADLRELKQIIRHSLGSMRFYRVSHAGHSEVNFTSFVHIPEESEVDEESWELICLHLESDDPALFPCKIPSISGVFISQQTDRIDVAATAWMRRC